MRVSHQKPRRRLRKLTASEIIQIRQCVEIDDSTETGFRWLHRSPRMFPTIQAYQTWNTRYAGKPAGYVTPDGKVYVTVLKRVTYGPTLRKLLEIVQ